MKLAYPAVGITGSGPIDHAARPGADVDNGWAPAMCSSALWVSVEHIADGSVPLRAVSPARGVVMEGYEVAGQPVCCRKCSAAVTKWEASTPGVLVPLRAVDLEPGAVIHDNTGRLMVLTEKVWDDPGLKWVLLGHPVSDAALCTYRLAGAAEDVERFTKQ